MLETSDVLILTKAFARGDHEFVRGFVYLSEDAITTRIEEVDPSWSFSVNRIEHLEGNAVCHATLIIKGVARDGIGMQQVLEKAGEPSKGAATDALKRCARLFGIGRYLLNAPKEGGAFDKWLSDLQRGGALQPQRQAPPGNVTQLQQPAAPPKVVNGEQQGVLDEVFGKKADAAPTVGSLNMQRLYGLAKEAKVVGSEAGFNARIAKLKEEGTIRDASSEDAVIEALRKLTEKVSA